MSEEMHHPVPPLPGARAAQPPVPSNPRPEWFDSFLRAFGEDPVSRWGSRFARHAPDMLLVCDEQLGIRYHNRLFLRSIGHQKGTYVGESFLNFLPEDDRAEAEAAFVRLLGGRSSGMRIQANYLTLRGKRSLEAQVTRSARGGSSFYLYIAARDNTETVAREAELDELAIEPLMTGLPVAAFRTDGKLRVTRAYGELWEEAFGRDPLSLVGADLSVSDCAATPDFLRAVDCCETMAARSLRVPFEWEGATFEIAIEPFLDEKDRILGAVGMIRRAKPNATPQVATSVIADSEIPTQPVVVADSAASTLESAPHALSREDEIQAEEIARIRESIRPRSLSAEDFGMDDEEDSIALSN